jgi:hypothetical protein
MRQPRNPNEGWSDGSPRGGNYDWISDELYHKTLAVHDVLWRYAVLRFKQEANCPILIIGYGSVPMAIELSQWTYPIIYLAQSEKEAQQVRVDCEHQAGFFEKIVVTDQFVDIPKSRICIFTGFLGNLTEKQIYKWLDLLTRRCAYVVCAEHTLKKDWKKLLEKRYDVTGLWYKRQEYTFLEIRRRKVCRG